MAADPDVISASDSTRVLLLRDSTSSRLVWQKQTSSGWKDIWQSRNLYGIVPDVELIDLNNDGSTDLFWAFDRGELSGAMAVVAHRGDAKELPIDAPACNQPTLYRTENAFEVRVESPGVYSAEECSEPVVRVCTEAIQATWPIVLEIRDTTLIAVQRSPQTYRDLAAKYREAAATLSSLITADANLPGTDVPAEYCGEDVPERLETLADSAASLGERNRSVSLNVPRTDNR